MSKEEAKELEKQLNRYDDLEEELDETEHDNKIHRKKIVK